MLFQIVAHAKSVIITCQNTIFPSYPNQTKAFANLLTTDLSTPSPYTFSIYFQSVHCHIILHKRLHALQRYKNNFYFDWKCFLHKIEIKKEGRVSIICICIKMCKFVSQHKMIPNEIYLVKKDVITAWCQRGLKHLKQNQILVALTGGNV